MFSKPFPRLTALFVLLAVMVPSANAGKIVLANDEWTLSNSAAAWAAPNDAGTFATNVASWFTGGSAGNFLAYSSNFGLTGSNLANAMTGAGHSWTVSTAGAQTLSTLSAYNAVFLMGNVFDNSALIDYVNAGGNVYLAGGTGVGGAAAEAAQWNTFLNSFGMGFGTSYNSVAGNISVSSGHDIFQNVDHLYQNNGNDALDIVVSDPSAQVLVSQNGHDLYAVYQSASVPEPSLLALLGLGLVGVGSRWQLKK